MKTTLKKAARLLPFRRALLALGAKLPVALKSYSLFRFFRYLYEIGPRPPVLVSNLGLSSKLRIELPTSYSAELVFGRPEFYIGEKGSLELCRVLSKSCDAFLDLGSYEGYYALAVAAWSQGTLPVYFFEADPARFSSIQNLVNQMPYRNIQGISGALGPKNTQATLYIDKVSPEKTSLYPDQKAEKILVEVEQITLDTALEKLRFEKPLLKVDIEGAELDLIETGQNTLKKAQNVIMETLIPTIEKGLFEKMRALGFSAYYIGDYDLFLVKDRQFNYVHRNLNCLFTKLPREELNKSLQGSLCRLR